MSERGQRAKVVSALAPLDAIAVENPALPGTPDVNYIGGWVELKWLRAWPIGENTTVRFDHWTEVQRVWHLRRRRAGGRSWVLIQCKRDWLLLDGLDAILWLNHCHKAQLIKVAARHWPNGLKQKELITWVQHEQRDFSLTGADGARLKKMLQQGMA